MKYEITDATVSFGEKIVLSHIGCCIRAEDKIAVVGENGSGKTTLLRLLAGELKPDRDDKRMCPCIFMSGKLKISLLHQDEIFDGAHTAWEEMLTCAPKESRPGEYGSYVHEAGLLLAGLGFSREDMGRSAAAFSGGQQRKIALARLLMSKPDILLLDEPTNHLDMASVEWLEEYIRKSGQAVIFVSHDRFFIERAAGKVWELARGGIKVYTGAYRAYRKQKQKEIVFAKKAWKQGKEEETRRRELIARFKHRPNKAAFARSQKSILGRMDIPLKPMEEEVHAFTRPIVPQKNGSKTVWECKDLLFGYETPLTGSVSLKIRRGMKLGVFGENGSGKSTFLKTVAGLLKKLGGEAGLGNHIEIGYFDQQSEKIVTKKTVVDYFKEAFPLLTDKEARSILASYLFGGREAAKRVMDLSGGERARLFLAVLIERRPNFLILDEPTNHMDISVRETLESAFKAYQGTILFASHDRYFLSEVADSLLIFEKGKAFYYPSDYEHYLEQKENAAMGMTPAALVKAEDAALIEGFRAVAKAERERIRGFSIRQEQRDWELKMALAKINEARDRAAALAALEEKERYRIFIEEGESEEDREQTLKRSLEEAQEEWLDCCLAWYEIYIEDE